MEISSLAAKQKRLLEWKEFIVNIGIPSELRDRTATTLSLYAKVLADCWKAGTIVEHDAQRIRALERELDNFNEQIRLVAPATLPRELEK